VNQGWQCPKCHAVLAPFVPECPHCRPGQPITPETPRWHRCAKCGRVTHDGGWPTHTFRCIGNPLVKTECGGDLILIPEPKENRDA